MSSLPAAAKGFVVAAFGHNWVGPRPASFDHVQCTAVFSGKFMKRGVFVCEPMYVLYAVTYVPLDSSLVRTYVVHVSIQGLVSTYGVSMDTYSIMPELKWL